MHVAWVVDLAHPDLAASVAALRARLAGTALADAGEPAAGADLTRADAVIVWADRPLEPDLARGLARADVPVVLAGPTLPCADAEGVLAAAAGLRLGRATAVHDVRIRAGRDATDEVRPLGHGQEDGTHLGAHHHVTDRVLPVESVEADVEVLLVARVGLVEHPVLTWRPSTATAAWTLGAQPGAVPDGMAGDDSTRVLVQLLRILAGAAPVADVGVGLLGYGAIGHEHSRAVRAVPGLRLAAVCDTSPARLDAAEAAAPGVATTGSAADLLERADVDLIVVSTPPSTHAAWALRALESGRHVVIEKPFAIRTADADEVLAAARRAGRLAVVYQNRRYDPDHLAVQALVRSGALGKVFHVETFVGGYGHPCNLWHSDEEVSGGAFYDWGSHVLDQVLDLMPGEVAYVTAATHKRHWFDVTNADHSRVTLRFVDGAEAEFIHSDLAAALKPRWYVLGTLGALVGRWRQEKVVSRSDIGTLVEDILAPADSPPVLELVAADGSVTQVANPVPVPYAFHRAVADRVRFGLPMTVTGEQSRRVLSVMEAARESAASDGRPAVPR